MASNLITQIRRQPPHIATPAPELGPLAMTSIRIRRDIVASPQTLHLPYIVDEAERLNNLQGGRRASGLLTDIIPRNGPKLSCEETITNAGKNHSAVRHGVAGRSLQYVPGFFFESAGCARTDEQFSKREEWWRARCAAFDDSAPRKLAARF
jgi:hypothetical protein